MIDYNKIAESIWRSGFIKNKNKIKQEAKEEMRKLIANDIAGNLPKDKREEFLKACGT